MTQPLVSVILPVFNAAPFIDAAIGSIRRQDYRRLEILAIDDGSTDESLERLQRHAAKDERIVLISRENRGLIATLNEGVSHARGDLIARMDADDIAYQMRISRQVEAFAAIPRLALCGSRVDVLHRDRIWPGRSEPIFSTGDLRTLSLFFTLFIHSTVMMNRSVLGETLHYDRSYYHAEDFDLFRRITACHQAHRIETPLLAYRLHASSVTRKHRGAMKRTHLRIVTENLAADGFSGDLDALSALADEPNVENARRVADLLRVVEAAAMGRDAASSYEFGLSNLVVFLMNFLLECGAPEAAAALLDTAQHWRSIRRRERMLLHLSGPLPDLAVLGMRTSNILQHLIDLPRSRSAGTLLAEVSAA